MLTFIKAQAASIVGSLADFFITIVLTEFFHCWYITGNAAGNITGAIIQFILCRNWAFNATDGKTSYQLIKFVLVWVGNILLSAAGVYLLTNYFKLHYLVSKVIISALLGLTYNYFLQKKFVFA
jgi:putative flippase GtrA